MALSPEHQHKPLVDDQLSPKLWKSRRPRPRTAAAIEIFKKKWRPLREVVATSFESVGMSRPTASSNISHDFLFLNNECERIEGEDC